MALGTKRKASNILSKQPLDLPPATVHAFAGTTAPEGWAMCDGSEVSKTQYAALYAVIGDIYGTPVDSNNFVLPDLRGEFLRGLDDMGTAQGARGKDTDGTARTVGQTQTDQLESHRHITSPAVVVGQNSQWHRYGYSGTTSSYYTTGSGGTGYHPYSDYTGGNETRPANMAINYIIKL
jgi:microcystin-dependent protein